MRQELGRGLTLACAAACGVLVANLYYAQTLTAEIGGALRFARGGQGLVTTLTMAGYAAGLLLIVPLGDKLENRLLILGSVAASLFGLVGMGLAPSAPFFLGAAVLTGFCSAGAQVVVPFAAALVAEERRGRTIGNVMAGLFAGIMLARPAASTIAAFFGWRAVFLGGAVLSAVLWMGLLRALPRRAPDAGQSYGRLLLSLFDTFKSSPLLRRRAVYQGLAFAAFNVFWTSAPLELAGRFHLGQGRIALFALAGAGGALAAPVAGRLGDRGHVRSGTGLALGSLSVFLLICPIMAGWGWLAALVLLAVGLDAATQVNQVLGQKVIYAIDPERRGGVNALYMTVMFLIGSGGAAGGAYVFQTGGFTASALLGAGLAAAALLYSLTEPRAGTPDRPRPPRPEARAAYDGAEAETRHD